MNPLNNEQLDKITDFCKLLSQNPFLSAYANEIANINQLVQHYRGLELQHQSNTTDLVEQTKALRIENDTKRRQLGQIEASGNGLEIFKAISSLSIDYANRQMVKIERSDPLKLDGEEGKQLILLELLGKGAMGEVWLSFDPIEHRRVACKLLKEKEAAREINVGNKMRMRGSRHPAVVEFYGAHTFKSTVNGAETACAALVYEYVRGPNLQKYMDSRGGRLPEVEAAYVILHVLEGLQHLQRSTSGGYILHLDLHSRNILLNSDFIFDGIKIADFGLGKHVPAGDTIKNSQQYTGTPWNMPPEQVSPEQGKELYSRMDIWSVGCLCYHLVYGRLLFQCESVAEVVAQHQAFRQNPNAAFDGKGLEISAQMKEFMLKCLTFDKRTRPKFGELTGHAIFERFPKSLPTLNLDMDTEMNE